MSIFDRFRKPKNTETRQFFPYIEQYYNSGLFAVEKNAAVDRAVSLLSNTIGTLPLKMYQYTRRGLQEDWSSPLARLIADPAVEETPQLFYQNLVRFMAITGNAYIFKHKNSKGDVVALELVDPKAVLVGRFSDGRKKYTISGEAGGVFSDREVIHIAFPSEGYNGTKGMSPIQAHGDIVRMNDILQEYISLTFHNGVGSRFLITLDPDAYKAGSAKLNQLVSEFAEYMQKFVYGQQNSQRPLVTPPQTKISTIDMPDMVKANVMELYSTTCDQVYQLFNIPPEVINSKEQKYASLEQKYQDFLRLAILPLCNHIAQTLTKALIPAEDKGIFFFKFNFDELLETDYTKKVDSLIKMYHGGILNLNEVRHRLDLQSVENDTEGETRIVPSNIMVWNEETIDAFMARSKLALAELQEDKQLNHNDGSIKDENM